MTSCHNETKWELLGVSMKPVTVQVIVNIPRQAAFAAFTNGFFDWWPRDYSYSGHLVEGLVIGDCEGAFCSEFGPDGFRIDFGRVLEWSPPDRLVISWAISPESRPEPDPSKASEVTVEFSPEGETTRVRLTHQKFERHGDGAGGYAEEMGSEMGWPHILERFRASVG